MKDKFRLLDRLKKLDIWLIMLLAFAVRLADSRWMDYTNFLEFYRDYYMVSQIAHGTQIVLLGPPSILHGFHFGPFYYYLLVPFFVLFNGHPYSLIFTGILISVITVYAFFRILLLWFNNRPMAMVGALFLAISVYSLHLSSYVSNPNFLPLFVLWYFYYLTKVLSGVASPKNHFILGLAFGLATQLHATAMIVLPLVTAAALVLHKYRFSLRNSLSFLLAFVLSYSLYLFYELTHNFANLKRLFILGSRELNGSHYASGAAAIWNFFQGTLTPFNYRYGYTNIRPNSLNIIIAVLALAILCEFLYKLFKNQKPAPSAGNKISKIGLTITLAWTFFTCITMLLFARDIHDHYFIILWPVPIIALAYGVFWMKSQYNVFASLVALIVVISVLQIFSFYQPAHTPWSAFMPIYKAQYQNAPSASISEIGS